MSATNNQNSKVYDLEERTFQFAKSIALYVKKLSKNPTNFEYIKQLIRSSGSVGANYIEANEALGDKDFLMRVRISRKEAKESAYWLRLLVKTNDEKFSEVGKKHRQEAIELKKILSSIIIERSK